MIPLSVPHISGNEWTYVKDCLDTGWVSSAGSYVDRFERAICGYTGARYAVGCANGTAALQVALRLVGVVPGDEVIVPTLTFIAPVNAAATWAPSRCSWTVTTATASMRRRPPISS